jgi:hypothetical protein
MCNLRGVERCKACEAKRAAAKGAAPPQAKPG